MNRHAAVALLFILGTTSLAEAREYHYGALQHEALDNCDRLHWTGKTKDATSCYRGILQNNSEPLAIYAEAAWALGDRQAANRYFDRAMEADPNDSKTLGRWADLFAESHQLAEASRIYAEALALDADNSYARLASNLALVASHDAEARERVEALTNSITAPDSVRLRALFTIVMTQLQAGETNAAERTLDAAETLAEEHPATQLQHIALQAALAVRKKEDPKDIIESALAINPHYGDVYAIPAYLYDITFKYDKSGEFYQKAVDVQENHWEAHLELGTNHLRQNRPTKARKHLEISYSGDAFNPKAVNSLRLMDTFEELEVLNYPESSDALLPVLSLRLGSEESEMLAPYASALATEAIDTFSKRYQFELKETASIEIYPNHDDFIVRTLGLPGAGLLGVAFGYLVAMDSPSAKAGSDYHWGTTLWHEVAHIFTLEASEHNVSRWFSEGISVFEEWQTGPIAGTKIPLSVFKSLEEHDFLPIAELDKGFSQPTYDNQVIVSYMQAGLICEYIERTFGFQALVDMLEDYRQGLDSKQLVEKATKQKSAEFDNAFKKDFDARYGAFVKNLPSWIEHLENAAGHLREEEWQKAADFADAALAIYSNDVSPNSPWLIKAKALQELGDVDAEMKNLEAYWQQGGYQVGPLQKLATYFIDQGRKEEAMQLLSDINLVSPFELEVHNQLGELLLGAGDYEKALVEFEVAMALNPLDKAAAHYRLAAAYYALDRATETEDHLMTALEIAPHYKPAQQLLLKTIK